MNVRRTAALVVALAPFALAAGWGTGYALDATTAPYSPPPAVVEVQAEAPAPQAPPVVEVPAAVVEVAAPVVALAPVAPTQLAEPAPAVVRELAAPVAEPAASPEPTPVVEVPAAEPAACTEATADNTSPCYNWTDPAIVVPPAVPTVGDGTEGQPAPAGTP